MKKGLGLKGEANPAWKGDNVGYAGIHKWIIRQMGKPKKCELCESTDRRKYEWASKEHKYLRDTKEWLRLCTRCHRHYDKTFNINIWNQKPKTMAETKGGITLNLLSQERLQILTEDH